MDLCTELKALILSFLTQINTFNSSMLRPCVKWMKALKNFLQTHSVSHFVCLTLAGHFHENLPKISATDIHYKINVCNKLVGISHSCRNCVITGDWDSGIEMTKDLPFTVPLAIFAVHPFQNALKITNHIQGWASIDASCYQLILQLITFGQQGNTKMVMLHTIPYYILGTIQYCHTSYVFLPELWESWEDRTVPKDILAHLYNIAIYKTLRHIDLKRLAHLPRNYKYMSWCIKKWLLES